MGGPDTGPKDTERTRSLWFALLLTLANGFLDAHTYLARGGVFANVQTANVIFGAIDTSERKFALALAHVWPILALIPASAPQTYVTVPISFLAAVQIGLFRNIGDLVYLPVATTGNLMRCVEAGYDGFVEKRAPSRRAFGVYGALILAFAVGALIGAIATRAW